MTDGLTNPIVLQFSQQNMESLKTRQSFYLVCLDHQIKRLPCFQTLTTFFLAFLRTTNKQCDGRLLPRPPPVQSSYTNPRYVIFASILFISNPTRVTFYSRFLCSEDCFSFQLKIKEAMHILWEQQSLKSQVKSSPKSNSRSLTHACYAGWHVGQQQRYSNPVCSGPASEQSPMCDGGS